MPRRFHGCHSGIGRHVDAFLLLPRENGRHDVEAILQRCARLPSQLLLLPSLLFIRFAHYVTFAVYVCVSIYTLDTGYILTNAPSVTTHTLLGVGEAYKRTSAEVRSDIGLLTLMGAVSEPECDRVVAAITTMNEHVAFRLASVDLNYNKVLGVIASSIVAVLFILG